MIHPTAVVEPGAELGVNITVGPFGFVAARARVGDGCTLGPHASILPFTELGANCRVHAGVVLGDWPQDLAFAESTESGVKIGAGCVFREGVTVHRGTKPGTVTELGEQCYLMANSHVAHNCRLGRNVILANGVLLGGYVELGDRCFISGNAVVHQFVRVGRLAMIGGLGGVSKDVPPFCTVRSHTVNRISGLNVVGLRRAGLGPTERAEVKQAFTLLYRSGLNVSQAVEKMKAAFAAGPARELSDFVEASKRGICGLTVDAEAEAE
jgi:UDP-N-acetylglucosamine acyltransferase